jgi:predicted amidohydrolase YtcJ
VAWVNHEEDVAGRLRPGMRADVTVLDQDLFTIPPGEIGDTSVVMTVAGGTVVYGDRLWGVLRVTVARRRGEIHSLGAATS